MFTAFLNDELRQCHVGFSLRQWIRPMVFVLGMGLAYPAFGEQGHEVADNFLHPDSIPVEISDAELARVARLASEQFNTPNLKVDVLSSPFKMMLLPDDTQSVYAPPRVPKKEEGLNQGGVNLDLKFTYLSNYIYRGVDHSSFVGRSQKPNLQFEGTVSFDLDKWPHPFVGIFANLYNNDPVSRFQEVRPFAGLEWNLRPFTIAGGIISYIYPERETLNTAEGFLKITFDDSLLFRTERPVLSPYVFAAYDYTLNQGVYIEAGVKHDFILEDTGLTFTIFGDIAYINNIKQVFIFTNTKTSGLQHYDVGLIGSYSLNQFFRYPKRYGDIMLVGYLNYTDGINRDVLHTDTKVWGGVGLQFKY